MKGDTGGTGDTGPTGATGFAGGHVQSCACLVAEIVCSACMKSIAQADARHKAHVPVHCYEELSSRACRLPHLSQQRSGSE